MSRIGKQPIPLSGGVSLDQGPGSTVTVKGPKGQLTLELRPEVRLKVEDGVAVVEPVEEDGGRQSRAFHGMTRALLNNMVVGVSTGYDKTLEIVGVGWNAAVQGKKLVLNIGFCHPVEFEAPPGIELATPNPTTIVVSGIDKQAVGQLCAKIRAVRPPEPYKGKGIRYQNEYVRRKQGKSFGA